MSTLRLQDLVNDANAAAIDAARASARASRLRAAAIAEAERVRLTVPGADRFRSDQQLGELRLDGAGKPAQARVEKPDEWASWLAERAPDQVEAAIIMPAGRVEKAMELLDFAGLVDAQVSVRVTPAGGALGWLDGRSVIQADPDHRGAWNVLHIDGDGHTTPIPGLTATRPAPVWKLCPDTAKAKAAAEEGTSEAEEELAALAGGSPVEEAETATAGAA